MPSSGRIFVRVARPVEREPNIADSVIVGSNAMLRSNALQNPGRMRCRTTVEYVAKPRLKKLFDRDRTGPPVALAVIVGVGHGYTRPDGVVLAPLTALGP